MQAGRVLIASGRLLGCWAGADRLRASPGVLGVLCPSGRVSPSPPLLLPSWGIAGALVLGTGQVQAMPGRLSVKMHKLSPKKAAL